MSSPGLFTEHSSNASICHQGTPEGTTNHKVLLAEAVVEKGKEYSTNYANKYTNGIKKWDKE